MVQGPLRRGKEAQQVTVTEGVPYTLACPMLLSVVWVVALATFIMTTASFLCLQ